MAFEGFQEVRVPVRSAVSGELELEIYAKYKKARGMVTAGEAGGTRAATSATATSAPPKIPIVLLHGYPQTHFIWHKIANILVDELGFTCILPDLRGYGQSSKPRASPDGNHVEYSKREMANDVIQVVKSLGYDTFHIVAHDRGARVAHRLALDHPGLVQKMMLLDICPTLYMYEHTDMEFATKYWHWFFQLLPDAEKIIAGDPVSFFNAATKHHDFGAEARASYLEGFKTAEGIHGACEDYRAAATIDLEHDRASLREGRKLDLPLHVLWGIKGLIPKYGDVVGVWRSFCADENVPVSGKPVESAHYIPEEADEVVLEEIKAFLA